MTDQASRGTRSIGDLAAQASIAAIVICTIVTLSIFFDGRLAAAAQRLPADAETWGSFVSRLGQSGYMFAIATVFLLAALLARSRTRLRVQERAFTRVAERAAYVLVTLATSGIAAQIVKHIVGRARPFSLDAFGPYHFEMGSFKNALASFPSGHTTTAFAMAIALSLLFPHLRVALFTLAFAIGTSRVVVHAHYISDVAAGGLLGTASALIVARVMARRGLTFERTPRLTLKGRDPVDARSEP